MCTLRVPLHFLVVLACWFHRGSAAGHNTVIRCSTGEFTIPSGRLTAQWPEDILHRRQQMCQMKEPSVQLAMHWQWLSKLTPKNVDCWNVFSLKSKLDWGGQVLCLRAYFAVVTVCLRSFFHIIAITNVDRTATCVSFSGLYSAMLQTCFVSFTVNRLQGLY